MKHIFYVHSQITLIIAKLIIEEEKLREKDIIFLLARGIKYVQPEMKIIDFIYSKEIYTIPQTRNIFRCLSVLKEFDEFLNIITGGEKFKCYVPQNTVRALELMINHPKCISFSLVEEGTASYNTLALANEEYKLRGSYWDYIGYKRRIKKVHFFRPDYEKVYGLTSESFPGFRNKKILSLNSLRYGDSLKGSVYDGQILLIFDASLTFNVIKNESSLYQTIRQVLEKLEGKNKMFFKFHPSQKEFEKKEIFKIFLEFPHIEMVKISDEISIEEIAANSNNLTVVLNISSLAIYCSLFGHKVYSYADILTSFEKSFQSKLSHLPKIFKDSVTFINDLQQIK